MSRVLNFTRTEVIGNVFEVPDVYQNVKAIGVGGFGLVWSVFHRLVLLSQRRLTLFLTPPSQLQQFCHLHPKEHLCGH